MCTAIQCYVVSTGCDPRKNFVQVYFRTTAQRVRNILPVEYKYLHTRKYTEIGQWKKVYREKTDASVSATKECLRPALHNPFRVVQHGNREWGGENAPRNGAETQKRSQVELRPVTATTGRREGASVPTPSRT